MKHIKKMIFVFIGIFLISCADASNYENVSKPKINTEILKEFSKPVVMNFNHAKAISVAISIFSNSNNIQLPIESYLVGIFEIYECYFVTISLASNETVAGYPPRYCINKNNFEVEDLPQNVKEISDVTKIAINPTDDQKMAMIDSDLQQYINKNIINNFYRPSGMNGGQAKSINVVLESVLDSGNSNYAVENYFFLVAKTDDNYFVRFGIPTDKALSMYSHSHYCVNKQTFDLVECPVALFENLQDKEWKWLLYERNIKAISD